MSHWNHRVVREVVAVPEFAQKIMKRTTDVHHFIAEVHYRDDGTPEGYTTEPIAAEHFAEWDDDAEKPEGPIESIRSQLERMLAALDKPVLDAATDFPTARNAEGR